MSDIKADITVDITGLKCPIPLLKTRKTVNTAEKGQFIEFIGTPREEVSRKEILMAIEALNQNLVAVNQNYNQNKWRILIQKI